MYSKRVNKCNNKLKAVLVTGQKVPCIFCKRKVDDELLYGKLYAIGDIQCHYFCVLLSCCLIQKGKDEDGLFGFLYSDILAEVERSKKHRCSYCSREGANLGCSITQCRKQFHLPCGRERNAVSLFYGNYKSFCQNHAPKQKLPDTILANARKRMSKNKQKREHTIKQDMCTDGSAGARIIEEQSGVKDMVCVICYEIVSGYPTPQTFWPPCCARDAWFHRTCLERMALNAGMHYLKCPLCNDKERFCKAVISQGYYVPDRDAAWELEQNAYADIYERSVICNAQDCKCPMGRDHDMENGMWDINLCILCGSSGVHVGCTNDGGHFVCEVCKPAAPEDLEQLHTRLETVTIEEQSSSGPQNRSRGPVMRSRMSLRRTKARTFAQNTASSSKPQNENVKANEIDVKEMSQTLPAMSTTFISRQELNLKTPKKLMRTNEMIAMKSVDNISLSPLKLVEQRLREKASVLGINENVTLDSLIVNEIKEKLKKPKPLKEKKRIINEILESMLNKLSKESPKCKEPVIVWNSPRKCTTDLDATLELEKNKTPVKIGAAVSEITRNKQTDTNDVAEVEQHAIAKLEEISCYVERNTANVADNDTQFETDKQDDANTCGNTIGMSQSPEISANINNVSPLVMETPAKLKTVDIQNDSSMEISENDQVINIDLIKMDPPSAGNGEFLRNLNLSIPVKKRKCSLKFSAVDKEKLQEDNVDIDMESFKNYYLNEVDRDFSCKSVPKCIDNYQNNSKLHTPVDCTIEASLNNPNELLKEKKDLKRKTPTEEAVPKKKRKKCKNKLVLTYNKKRIRRNKIKNKTAKKQTMVSSNIEDILDLTVAMENDEKLKNRTKNTSKRNVKTKLSIQDKGIKVNIKWRREQLKLKISQAKMRRIKKEKHEKRLHQYVLKFSPEGSSNDRTIVKPQDDVTPIKRKYIKHETINKVNDGLIQTSIQSFFKLNTLQS